MAGIRLQRQPKVVIWQRGAVVRVGLRETLLIRGANGGCRPSDESTLWLIRILCGGRPFIDLAHTSTSGALAPFLKINLGNYNN